MDCCYVTMLAGTTTLSSLLLESLWENFVAPIILWPLLQPTALDAADEALLRKVSASAASDALHQLSEPHLQQDRTSWQEQDLPPGIDDVDVLHVYKDTVVIRAAILSRLTAHIMPAYVQRRVLYATVAPQVE